jgi:hypothetical protein
MSTDLKAILASFVLVAAGICVVVLAHHEIQSLMREMGRLYFVMVWAGLGLLAASIAQKRIYGSWNPLPALLTPYGAMFFLAGPVILLACIGNPWLHEH